MNLSFPIEKRDEIVFNIVIIVTLLVFPFVAPSNAVSLGYVALHYSLLALGLNIVLGWTGLLDIGAAGFVAIGAYGTAITMTQFRWPPLAVLPMTFVLGFIAGVLLGIPTLRHRLDYFAILTLGFAELVALSIRNWPSLTKGSFGFSGIPATSLPFVDEPLRAVPPTGFYLLALSVLIPSYGFLIWLRSTVLGRHFHVIKQSETVGRVYGINIFAIKLIAFGLSAAFLATGGFFWASYQRSIVWNEFGIVLSFMLVAIVVVGGLGNPKGVVFGAVLVGCSLEIIRRLLTLWGLPQETRFLIFSVALILVVHLRSKGIVTDQPKWLNGLRSDHVSSIVATEKPVRISADTQSGYLLEINNIAKSYGGVIALDGLSFHVAAGECLALIGPNGSGKTTLLNCICGLTRPDRGEIFLHGNSISKMATHRRARAGIGRSFQDISVFEDVTVRDNVYLTSQKATYEQIDRVLRRFGLNNGDSLTDSLSYGSKKALDLARLLVEPERLEILLLDEPTAGLTQHEARDVVNSLSELRQTSGLAAIIVSHDVMFLEALNVDRVIVLNRGKLFKDGKFVDLRQDSEVRTLFWGKA